MTCFAPGRLASRRETAIGSRFPLFFDEAIFFAATGYEDDCWAQLNAPHKAESVVVIPGEKRGPLPDYEALDEGWAISRGGQIGEASG